MKTPAALLVGVGLLLCLWVTALPGLDRLPLHNDEGLHLRRAVEVWNGHPFWDISDGKIINHWPIALFYPQQSPVFVGRIATLLVSLIGLAAGLALARRLASFSGVLCAGLLWLTSPYLFFFERLALSDAQAGALVVVVLWLAEQTARTGRYRILTGLALGGAMLFKFTAAPYLLSVAILLLAPGTRPLRQRVVDLLVIGMVAGLCFVPPLAYLALRGRDFFGIALAWVGGESGGLALGSNLERLWSVLTGFGTLGWLAVLLGGLVLLAMKRERWTLMVAWAVPFVVMTLAGREVLPRHYIVALPLALVLAGSGLGLLLAFLSEQRERVVVGGLAAAVLVFGFVPFMRLAHDDPGALTLPTAVSRQYITDHSAGYGLREAMLALPQTVEPGLPIIASMFPDSCRRANFYAAPGFRLICAAAPGLPEIEQALAEQGTVYVLVDNAPLIGVDVTTLDATAELVAAYPRPGESDESASVQLWRLP